MLLRCGPAGYELKDQGHGTFEFIQVDPNPHCGEEQQKVLAMPHSDVCRVLLAFHK